MPDDKIIKLSELTTADARDLVKALAMDIGKQVAHHIEIMYPEAVKAASSSFLLSVRNCTYNEIMAAIQVDDQNQIITRLRVHDLFRREVRAAYKRIRKDDSQ